MIPAAFVPLPSFPLTASGKVDRAALPAPDRSGTLSGAHVPPRGHVEETIAAIFAEALGLADIGVHDDFFALGGHSLLATQVVSRLRAAFDVELPLRQFFESPTVLRLTACVETLVAASVRATDDAAAEGELDEVLL
jgi:acyl carrier protein